MMVIACPEMQMNYIIADLEPKIRKYGEMFDIYYIRDKEEAGKYFSFSHMPWGIPLYYIIDPSQR